MPDVAGPPDLVIALPEGAEFRVWHRHRFCETVYPLGNPVPAAPHDHDPSYAARARALGYDGPDPGWQMCYTHELLHSLLAAPQASLTLSALALGLPADRPDHFTEEGRVLSAQQALNRLQASVAAAVPPTPES